MTMRIALVAGKRAQSGVTLRSAATQPRGKSRHEGGFEVADNRNPGGPREHDRGEADEDGRAEAGPAPADRREHERSRERDTRAGEQAGEQDAHGDAKPCANTDPVPGAHLQPSVVSASRLQGSERLPPPPGG